MSSSARTSNSLSRRSARSARPTLRQQSLSRSSLHSSPGGRSSEFLSAEVEGLADGQVSPSASLRSTRKSRLATELREREEADQKEREREQRKALMKEKRQTSQLLVQVRHAANECLGKVKRGNQDITKVQDELDKLQKWRQGQEDRLHQLMRELVEEKRQMEEEFEQKHAEADVIRRTLELEQSHLENQLRAQQDEVGRVEVHMQRVLATLQHLDDGNGVTSLGGWRSQSRGLLEDSSSTMAGSRSGSLSLLDTSAGSGLKRLALQDQSASLGWDYPPRSGNEVKASRGEERPIPLPISANRNSRTAEQGLSNGFVEKQPQLLPQSEVKVVRPRSSSASVRQLQQFSSDIGSASLLSAPAASAPRSRSTSPVNYATVNVRQSPQGSGAVTGPAVYTSPMSDLHRHLPPFMQLPLNDSRRIFARPPPSVSSSTAPVSFNWDL